MPTNGNNENFEKLLSIRITKADSDKIKQLAGEGLHTSSWLRQIIKKNLPLAERAVTNFNNEIR